MTEDPLATSLHEQLRPSSDREESEVVPKNIGRFRIERILGKGGFGIVFLGHDEQLQRHVAIKVPKPQFVERLEDRGLYLKEARTVAGLEHPNIVPVHEVGSTPEFPIYIVSKFIVGQDLALRIQSEPPNHQQAIQWMIDLADALKEAHRKGFVHRDVKPQNVLVDKDDRVYLVDFGLALADHDVGKHLPAGGTPAYMSPEQARGEGHRVDGRSDLFSLGILFYELLCGRRPFQGDSRLELFEQITSLDPKPLRQWDDSVPHELERICLKMLAKRKSDRYSSAKDLIDDLKVFLAKVPGDSSLVSSIVQSQAKQSSSNDTQKPTEDATPHAITPSSDSKALKIVPKGLRSFDHRDADFFLELLPGPRDRDGLPESVGFWKSRIEEPDAEQTFLVGLVYGPSGCGKSSMVKAGLLPRLSPDIVSIYLEATPEDTERTLLTLIRKRLESREADSTSSLVDLLHEVRRGRLLPRGKKLFLVIDQFEQWLFAHPNAAGEPLLQSLLQCDGSRIQAIVMVRDDFWMAATRFFRDLDIPLLERINSAAVDLFDLDHAERVLKAYGRAFEKLESDGQEEKQDRKQFIAESVRGLSENGKVISVRLALFAEMMKSRPWTPESLREVGGTSGVGATFLEETFSATGAPPPHRYHQAAARSVLRALLPEAGSDIKGHQRSRDELRAASHYESRPRDFGDLIRILDGELRLITPVDTTGVGNEPEALADVTQSIIENQKSFILYYQLTHDYLVPTLRDWLTRKQRETRRGRAELKLAERAGAWNAKREAKQLPTTFEWLGINLLSDRKRWTEPQRSMMHKATKAHLSNWGMALGVLAIVSLGGYHFLNPQRLAGLEAQTRIAVDAAQNNLGANVQYTIRDLQKLPRELVIAELKARFAAEIDPSRKLGLAFALARYEQVEANFLVGQIDIISQEDSSNYIAALEFDREQAITALREAAMDCDKPQWRRKAKLATVELYLGSRDLAEDMCVIENRPDPEQRTLFIDEFPKWSGDLHRILEIASACDNAALRSALCLAAGQIPDSRLTSEDKQSFAKFAGSWYRDKSEAVTHSASGWLLRKWGLPEPEISDANKIVQDRPWFVNSAGMTMLRIMPGTFHELAESNEEGRDRDIEMKEEFWLADREVTVGQFTEFIDDNSYDSGEKPVDWKSSFKNYSPTPNHPAMEVNWYDAIMYCNWLSQREGRVPCYEKKGEKEKGDPKIDAWRLVPRATGYRLPLEQEWEFACRAGTATSFSIGDDETLLRSYAQFDSRKSSVVCGEKLPNGGGLFDVHGNAYEWCGDTYASSYRVIRGGGWSADASDGRSAHRRSFHPSYCGNSIGFRLALSPSAKSPEAEIEKK